jgi:ATP-dependent Clp protease ATP-binding subunit ClpC
VFERFTDSARRAVLVASEIAGYQRQEEIATNHLLFGIVSAVGQDLAPVAGDVILALGTDPQSIRDLLLSGFDEGTEPSPGHLPFTSNVRLALERAAAVADTIGSNHVGAEHLLAGLAGGSDDQAGRLLAQLGFTTAAVIEAITDRSAPEPTSARSYVVYVPVGKSIFKNGGRIYPELAAATAAHPDQEIAAMPLVLADGEFFDLVLGHNGNKSVGRYATYPDAYAAAEAFRVSQGVAPAIRIMVPAVEELRGKDSRGRDVVLGSSVEYSRTLLTYRLGIGAGAVK